MILKKPKLLSLQTPNQMQKRKKKKEREKRRKVCCRIKSNASKNTTLFAAEDAKADANFSLFSPSLSLSLSLSLSVSTRHTKSTHKGL